MRTNSRSDVQLVGVLATPVLKDRAAAATAALAAATEEANTWAQSTDCSMGQHAA